MRTLKLVLEYDGFDYCGWQVQAEAPTLQGVIEAALEKILGERIRIHGAGRTDAKVHALGQVASFRCPSDIPATALQRALNSLLPRDVVVHEVQDVPARFSCALFGAWQNVHLSDSESAHTRPIAVTLCLAYPAGFGSPSGGAGGAMPTGDARLQVVPGDGK